jgi:hypothetical protein
MGAASVFGRVGGILTLIVVGLAYRLDRLRSRFRDAHGVLTAGVIISWLSMCRSATRLQLDIFGGRRGDVGIAGGAEARDQEAHRDREEQRQRNFPRLRRVPQDAEEKRPDRGEQVAHRLPHARKSRGVLGVGRAQLEKVRARLKHAPWPSPKSTTHRALAVPPATSKPKVPAPDRATAATATPR